MSLDKIKIGIIGGSGLDNPEIFENPTQKCVSTPYGNPSDLLMEGRIGGVDCVLLPRHGRSHSIMPGNINFRANIWALKEQNCTHIIATTATGSLQEEIVPGSLVILDSFIDRTQGRKQTFYDGMPGSPPGVCHLPMEPAFCPSVRAVLIETATEMGIPFSPTGSCVAIEGPRFSSRTESNMYRLWGGHVINMTIVPEVVLAKEAGICYVSIAMATDYCCWRQSEKSVSVGEVVGTFKKNVTKVTDLIIKSIPKIAKIEWRQDVKELRELIAASFQNK